MRVLALVALLCVSATPIDAFANEIREMTVSTPACSGFAGRVNVTLDLQSDTVWTQSSTIVDGVSRGNTGVSWSGAFGGPGITPARPLQFLPGTQPDGTLVSFSIKLYEDGSLAALLDSKEITFFCDSGELYVPPSVPVTTLPAFLLFGLSGLLAVLGMFRVRA